MLAGLTVVCALTQMTCEKIAMARSEATQIKNHRYGDHLNVSVRVEDSNDGLVPICTADYCVAPRAVPEVEHVVVEETNPHVPPQPVLLGDERDEILYKVERETGVEAKILYGVCMVESRCSVDSININTNGTKDNGPFQINSIHGISDNTTNDFEFSARWTADYLIRNGYFQNKEKAIQCHNFCGVNNGYLEKVKAMYSNTSL